MTLMTSRDASSSDLRALDIIGTKWVLLITQALRDGPVRYNAVHASIPGISAEAFRLRMQLMQELALVSRMKYSEFPPRVEYELTEKGAALLTVVDAGCAWGAEWA